VPLAGVDQKHLAWPDRTGLFSVIELEAAVGHDQRNRNGVAVLGHCLACVEAQANHAHRSAIRDLLEAESARRLSAA
jgi:hypothetical protein